MRKYVCFFVTCLVIGSAGAAEIQVKEAWRVTGRGGFSAPNVLRDPNGGNLANIVVCEIDLGVVCFDVRGKRLWEYAMVPPVTAAPAVADVTGDGRPEVVAADSKGNLAALSATGAVVWSARVPDAVIADSCPAVVDLDEEGLPEILVGDASGTLTCLDNTGKVRWQFTGDGTQMGPVLCADIYSVPGKEIIVTSHDRHIYALNANGEWLWDLYRRDDLFPNSTPVLADVDGDNVPELYIGGGLHHFYRIDLAAHRIVLEENVMMHINGAITAADLDGDGKDEVVFGNKGGGVWCYGNGAFHWKREFRNSTLLAAPTVVNLDGDPALELILHSRGEMQFLDTDGKVLSLANSPCSVVATPVAGDLDGDGKLDLLTTSPGGMLGNTLMTFLTLNVPFRDDPRNRLTFAADPAHTGRAPGEKVFAVLDTPLASVTLGKAKATPTEALTLLSGPNTWRFDVENPELRRLVFNIEVNSPDGTVRRYARHVRTAKERALVSFSVDAPGDYGLRWRLVDADQLAVLAQDETALAFHGFESDQKFLEQGVFPAIEAVSKQWRETNPGAAAFVRSQLVTLKGTLAGLTNESGADRVEGAATLRNNALRLRALAEAGIALAPKGSFFAWRFNPWAYFDARDTVATPGNRTEQLETALCVGEYDSLALNVTNVSGQSLEVRVWAEDLAGTENTPAKNPVEFRRAVTVPTIRREMVADALPLLDQGGLLRIPPMESQQLWISVNAKDLKPGEHTVTVKLKSVEPDPTVVSLPLHIKVHNLELPRPRPLRFCLWAYDGSDLGTDRPDVLRDLIDHGVTVFFGVSPKATCTPQGELVGPLDFAEHDENVARLGPHGILLYGHPQGAVSGQPFLSEPWKKAFIAYLRAWAAHMKELGRDYSQWALYPYDEPSSPFTETTLNLVEVAKLIREADPNILIYANPTSGTTMETVKMLTGLIDIWCPSAELLERLGPELVPAAKQVGKEVWFYDASGGAHTLSCLGLYRWRFWYAWNQGFTGAGWWTYALHGNVDRWDGPNETGDFFATVYDGPGGVVGSKRWEVAREGIEDYELLYLLRESIRKAESAGASSAAIAAARKILDETPKNMEAMLLNVGRRLPLMPDSVPVYEEATRALEEARAAIIAACLSLQGEG